MSLADRELAQDVQGLGLFPTLQKQSVSKSLPRTWTLFGCAMVSGSVNFVVPEQF